MQPLLSAQDVASRMGVTPSAVRRWAREGLIPAVKLPGAKGVYRFLPEDVDRLATPERAAR